MSMLTRIACLVLVASAVAGCERKTQDATQIIMTIDAEPNVRARTSSLQIQVRGLPTASATWDYDETLEADQDRLVFPYSLALVPKNGDDSRKFEVLLTARTAKSGPGALGQFVAVSRTLSGYRAHRRLLLPVTISDDCIGRIACDPDQTCQAAQCAPASVDPTTLQDFSGSMVPEASVSKPDAAVPPPPPLPDAGEDAAVDPACPNGQCLCAENATIPCGAERGECKLGVQTCVNNLWGPCLGQISRTDEICNDLDDDCDGNSDEAVICDPRDTQHTRQAICLHGACISTECEAHFGDCNPDIDGCEQLLNTLQSCGACGASCDTVNAWPTCETGECVVDECFTDFDDCDGNPTDCETALDSLEHCGACDAACARENASVACGGPPGERVCELTSCDGDFGDCDEDSANGCESDLDSDDHNCGACDNDCSAKGNLDQGLCVAGHCIFDCQENFADCDGLESNGCETNLQIENCSPRCFQRASNLDLSSYGYPSDVDFNCAGPHTFNSSTAAWDTNCCGTCPDVTGPVTIGAAADPVYVLRAKSLNVAVGATVKLIGAYPVVIAVLNNATIAGTIDASAVTNVPGAGGSTSLSCDSVVSGNKATGQDGTYSAPNTRGGGGGGFGTAGGLGGGVSGSANNSTWGRARGATDLIPLRGGCSGGKGALSSVCIADPIPVGAGGGAFQLSVAGKLTITGTGSLLANGGVGNNGVTCTIMSNPATSTAGSGGGSGGGILLEASAFSMGALEAVTHVNGAAGGMSATNQSGGAGSTDSSTAGSKGTLASPNTGGGGGGGFGRVFMRSCVGP
jgi:hypothetical protein